MRFDATWLQKEHGVCLKKQIGKSTLRGQNEGIPGGGAYPFPGDLRAKFAWKEANRLSRGELIDNTAVTCSSLDRRPATLPLSLFCRSSHPLLRFSATLRALRRGLSNFGEIHFICLDRRAILRSLSIPQSWIYSPNFEIRHIGYAQPLPSSKPFAGNAKYQESSRKQRSESYRQIAKNKSEILSSSV